MLWTYALGALLIAVQLYFSGAIALHLRKTKSSFGQSLSSEAIGLIGGIGWLIYGAITGDYILALSGAVAVLGAFAIGLQIIRKSQVSYRTALLLASLVGVALLLGDVFGGILGLSIALSALGAVQFLPQIYVSSEAIYRRNAPGVSLQGALIRLIYLIGWTVYALASVLQGMPSWPLAVWGLTGTVAYGLQLLSWAIYRNALKQSRAPLQLDLSAGKQVSLPE